MVEVLAMHGAIGSARGWRSLLTNFTGSKIERISAAYRENYMDVICNQLSEDEQDLFKEEHIKEILNVLGDDGVLFTTEVLIAAGEK